MILSAIRIEKKKKKNCLLAELWLNLRWDHPKVGNEVLKLFIFCIAILSEHELSELLKSKYWCTCCCICLECTSPDLLKVDPSYPFHQHRKHFLTRHFKIMSPPWHNQPHCHPMTWTLSLTSVNFFVGASLSDMTLLFI